MQSEKEDVVFSPKAPHVTYKVTWYPQDAYFKHQLARRRCPGLLCPLQLINFGLQVPYKRKNKVTNKILYSDSN